jgi:8-oxo-dGTP pyrophosphatase MutT (NUDIX family)
MNIRGRIAKLVAGVPPLDSIESNHQAEILDWIVSGAQLFRIHKPDVPRRHLVSYVALVDSARRKILLVDHKNAGLWLPTGGHVELDEDPALTARRELAEELKLEASFLYPDPFFLTVTRTIGIDSGHEDVSLWYVLSGDSSRATWFDAAEFNGVAWFGFDEVPFERSDPHMRRFMNKLQSRLGI